MPNDALRPPPSDAGDLALMLQIADGSTVAFQQFYDRHAGLVLALCLRVLHNRAEAEDLLIDVFYEMWNRSERFDASRGSPLTYLTLLTRSRAIDRKRSLGSGAGPSEPIMNELDASSKETPLDGALSGERQRIIRKALRELDVSQRQAIECAFYDGLSHSEIATRLNRPLGSVKTSIRQGLIRLRDTLRTLGGGEFQS